MKWFYNLKLRSKIMIGYLLIGLIALFAGTLIPSDLSILGVRHLILLLPLILCIVIAISFSLFI